MRSFYNFTGCFIQPLVINPCHRENRLIFYVYVIRYLLISFMPPFEIAITRYNTPFLHDRFPKRGLLKDSISPCVQCHAFYLISLLLVLNPDRNQAPLETLNLLICGYNRIVWKSECVNPVLLLFLQNFSAISTTLRFRP